MILRSPDPLSLYERVWLRQTRYMEPWLKHELRPLIKTCLQSLKTEQCSPTAEVCEGLCLEPHPLLPLSPRYDDEGDPVTRGGNRPVLHGYPEYPLYKRLSDSISTWMTTGCPVLDLPEMYILNEEDALADRLGRLAAVGGRLASSVSLWTHWSDTEKLATLADILKSLDVRGILDLLGIRQTAGSIDCLPPCKELLMTTFTALHSPKAKLSVGARALSKHCHRDGSHQWWGECTGTQEAKNAHAIQKVLTILREAAWINIHTLPHEVKIIEVRIREGYGARWSHDGSEFRGFVEPQMEDGHLVGWRH